MPAQHRWSPTAYSIWPVVASVGTTLLVAWIVCVGLIWSWSEAIGIALSQLPAAVVAIMLARLTRRRSSGEPVFVRADERKVAEALAKLVVAQVFGIVITAVAGFARLPYFASGASFVIATLVGVTAWLLAAEVFVVIATGERRPPGAPDRDS